MGKERQESIGERHVGMGMHLFLRLIAGPLLNTIERHRVLWISSGLILIGIVLCLPNQKAAQIFRKLPSSRDIWSAEPAVSIGLRKQLLVDDFVISDKSNISREMSRAAKENGGRPVIVSDKPWENQFLGAFVSVVHDGQKFQIWYNSFNNLVVGYAESTDGLRWTKPNLGVYDWDPAKQKELDVVAEDFGNQGEQINFRGKENNIVGIYYNGFIVFRDPHETDPAHLYKATYGPKINRGICIAHSSDGIHNWTPYNQGETVLGPPNDCLNQILWDEDAKLYRFYGRLDFGEIGGSGEVRGSRHMVNRNLKASPANWVTVRNWEFNREGPEEYKRRQIMTLTSWIYEGVHFAIVNVYEFPVAPLMGAVQLDRKTAEYFKRHERDVTNVYLGTSRDGDSWELSWIYAGKPFLQRGPDGSWDKDYLQPAPVFVTWKDRHWLYYGGFNERNFGFPGKSGIGGASIRLDGFVYLEPWIKEDAGWVVTKPFKLEGSKLEVNADAKQGWLAVEVLEAGTGEPISGYSHKESKALDAADGLRVQMQWQNQADLATLKGQRIRLKFYLKNAKLYAFQVQP